MAGALGLGGGIIVVPGLVFFFELTHLIPEDLIMHVAIASSLGVVFFTSLASLQSHRRLGEILWSTYYKIGPGLVSGACLGAFTSTLISTSVLKIIFTVFLIGLAVKMFFDLHRTPKPHQLSLWFYLVCGFATGCFAALLGIGGGVLLIPFFSYAGIAGRKITPLANLGGLTVAFIGMFFLTIDGLHVNSDARYLLGYVYWPAVLGIAIPSSLIAPFGAKLNYILPEQYLKYGFIVILVLTAIKMLF